MLLIRNEGSYSITSEHISFGLLLSILQNFDLVILETNLSNEVVSSVSEIKFQPRGCGVHAFA